MSVCAHKTSPSIPELLFGSFPPFNATLIAMKFFLKNYLLEHNYNHLRSLYDFSWTFTTVWESFSSFSESLAFSSLQLFQICFSLLIFSLFPQQMTVLPILLRRLKPFMSPFITLLYNSNFLCVFREVAIYNGKVTVFEVKRDTSSNAANDVYQLYDFGQVMAILNLYLLICRMRIITCSNYIIGLFQRINKMMCKGSKDHIYMLAVII